ncbi:GNAT family N-acetyltransferase (plasmid) [Entomospira nematocerorum]|uniref:GNAT family N-acetyltransferase n=1 Tax=Entomospira nematocerorum TaxID=2719987 RepID=A0A968GG61_9SPIO|nr:GNAT family N-acetyltransferase [Entomospira nematocera]NIZ47653.1 GNAT family N-acetyltransferase [Entomospira nematocera]WDI34545.1 GNAT family N-acetyltransferase [Entomospira nematocera]
MKLRVTHPNQRDSLLLDQLYAIWHESVIATHHFLSPDAIMSIGKLVPAYLSSVPILITISDTLDAPPRGFLGIESHTIAMLFIHPSFIGKGLGRSLITYAIQHYHVNEVSVNEHNPAALGFYQHLGFQITRRESHDEQGNPYPILYLRL